MENNMFMSAEEVAECLGTSKAYAYKLIQKLNKEMNQKGYITFDYSLITRPSIPN